MRSRTLDSVSVAELARQAQVSRTTFYAHFNNAYEVFQALIGDYMADVQSLNGRLSDMRPHAPRTYPDSNGVADGPGEARPSCRTGCIAIPYCQKNPQRRKVRARRRRPAVPSGTSSVRSFDRQGILLRTTCRLEPFATADQGALRLPDERMPRARDVRPCLRGRLARASGDHQRVHRRRNHRPWEKACSAYRNASS